MSSIPNNPFTNRSTIRNEHDFVGRDCRANCQFARPKNGLLFQKYLFIFVTNFC